MLIVVYVVLLVCFSGLMVFAILRLVCCGVGLLFACLLVVG